MPQHSFQFIRTRTFAATVLASTLTGCVADRPVVDLPARFEGASGIVDAVTFQTDGEPLDVVESREDLLQLTEAVRRALAHGPGVQAAVARVRVAEAEASQARLLPNPILSVVFRFPEGGGSPNVEAGLAAELTALLLRPGQTRAADNRLRAAAAEAVSAVLDLLAEVQERYVAVQTADELLELLRERLSVVDRLVSLANDRLRVGEATQFDVLGLETQRLELLSDVAEQELQRRDARLSLSRLIGEPSGEAEWAVARWEPNLYAAAPESLWVDVALANRPELQVRQFELAALGAELGLTRFAPFGDAEAGVEAERDGGQWEVGPSVSTPIPLFDFGQARRRRARAALVEARHNLTQSRRQVTEETRRAYAAFAATHDNLERVRGELVPMARRRQQQAEEQFRADRIDITGLLQAEEDLRQALGRSVELERRNTEALIRLQRAAGGPGVAPPLTDAPASTRPAAPGTRPAGTQPAAARGDGVLRANPARRRS